LDKNLNRRTKEVKAAYRREKEKRQANVRVTAVADNNNNSDKVQYLHELWFPGVHNFNHCVQNRGEEGVHFLPQILGQHRQEAEKTEKSATFPGKGGSKKATEEKVLTPARTQWRDFVLLGVL